jgi:hypothetical protein
MKPISPDFIKKYVDQLLEFAKGLPPDSSMRTAALMRAEHVMDLVAAWKEHGDRKE